jgi:hypothetical protein
VIRPQTRDRRRSSPANCASALQGRGGTHGGRIIGTKYLTFPDKLLPHKAGLFSHLRTRWQDLFAAKFDVTKLNLVDW